MFLGGSPNISLVSERTQAQTGFRGCLRHLAINREVYDFRPQPKGDAIEGVDIGNFSHGLLSLLLIDLNFKQHIAVI